MTHSQRKWTQEEIEALHRLRRINTPIPAICEQLGRSLHSVKHRLEWDGMTVKSRLKRRARINRRRAEESGAGVGRHNLNVLNLDLGVGPRPTSELLHERDMRAQIPPRDLTAAFCGDPLPGYSALDRMEQHS